MHDPDFHRPVEKTSLDTEADALAAPPTCKLAVVSLVFGILGWAPLPLVGALVAVVTGHIALGEIRASGGRLGGRSAAKAGLILAYIWFALALVAALIIAALVRMPYETRTTVMSPARALPPASGVKMANELSTRDMESLKKLDLVDNPDGEDVIAVFRDATPPDGEPATAVLTSKRIAFLKGDRLTSFDLKDVDSVVDGPQYQQKYTPNFFDSSHYMIEIRRKSGGRMRIAIEPAHDGPSFSEALHDAWKAAGGKPEEPARK